MSLIKICTDPAIIIITTVFLVFIFSTVLNYKSVEKNLKSIHGFLSLFNKKELSYRFHEIDSFMGKNSFTSTAWEDFKKALIFPEKLYVASKNPTNTADYKPEIYLTADAAYFFNDESLIFTNINHKFIQIIPTILTGLGPFFTFLKMAIAFTGVNFITAENVGNSLNGLIANIQMAALCSVFAVGFSLFFMFIEKNLFNRMCKKHSKAIQKEFIRLFDVVTSEQFLLDLVKETRIQNNTNEKLLKNLPDSIANAISKANKDSTLPYLENILYSLNKLNENFDNNSGNDVVDKLF